MGWSTMNLMEARKQFIWDIERGHLAVSEVCRRHGISRKTGYKWIKRHAMEGDEALADQSRRPKSSPKKSSLELEQAIVEVRKQHPVWGGRKIRRVLRNEGMAAADLPAASTITNVLRRHGLLGDGMRSGSPNIERFERPSPNDMWQMDFKGHFATSRSGRCYPLTVLDDCSRYNLVLEACQGETRSIVQAVMERAFGRYGLPRQILCDHGNPWGKGMRPDGAPYGTPGFELWLLRLGVEVIHGRVRHPQTQGKEERFHRTLKAEVIDQKTQWKDHQACQKGFDEWREIYNHKRPHEALDDDVPSSKYHPSIRSMPSKVPKAANYELEGDEVRLTRSKGEITFKNATYYIGQGFVGEPIFLRQESDGSHGVYYCWKRIGRIDPSTPKKPKGSYNSIR